MELSQYLDSCSVDIASCKLLTLIVCGLVALSSTPPNHSYSLRPCFYRGPDIPCFLNILKWVMTSTNDTNGSRKVCILYNRDSLPDLTLNPPSQH